MSNMELKMPVELVAVNTGSIQVIVRCDDRETCSKQVSGPIMVPDCELEPLVLVQGLDGGQKTTGDVFVYDYDMELFVVYDEDEENSPPVDEESKSNVSDLTSESKVVIETESLLASDESDLDNDDDDEYDDDDESFDEDDDEDDDEE